MFVIRDTDNYWGYESFRNFSTNNHILSYYKK